LSLIVPRSALLLEEGVGLLSPSRRKASLEFLPELAFRWTTIREKLPIEKDPWREEQPAAHSKRLSLWRLHIQDCHLQIILVGQAVKEFFRLNTERA